MNEIAERGEDSEEEANEDTDSGLMQEVPLDILRPT
jgi:hypothetical protein